MIEISPSLVIDESELHFDFIRSAGPGGQNVNKVSTAVQLRFDALRSPSLSGEVRERLLRLAGSRLTGGGVVLIEAKQYRTQEQNRRDAVQRLVGLLRQAAEKPKARHKTRPTLGSRQKRLEEKRRRGSIKNLRKTAKLGEE